MVVHTHNPSYSGSEDRRIKSSRPAQAKLVRPMSNTKGLRAPSKLECSPSMHQALSSKSLNCRELGLQNFKYFLIRLSVNKVKLLWASKKNT
jgi:hypothetical protein